MARGIRWAQVLLRLGGRLLWDRLQKKNSPRQIGKRLRQMFESVGGPGVKLGQQLAVRVDFIPFEVSQELGKLMDDVKSFDISVARQRIVKMTGKPIEETFASIDPKPIGAASIACVWKAVLHSGEAVAVKVRRPNAVRSFTADLTIISLLTKVMEVLTIVRPGFFKYLRRDLHEMFLGEMDFRREANHMVVWRRYAKRDRIKWLSAPRVYSELSNNEILTTEFIEGYSCSDILLAVESKNAEALRILRSQNIDPKVLGTRVMQLGMWGRLECPFFHADPHPGNILVRPDNQIVLLDFGACGGVNNEMVSHQIEMSRRLVNDDIAGGTAITLAMLAPLPNIDAKDVHRVLKEVMWNFQITVRSDDAQWWERTSAALWVWTLEAVRTFNLPVNLDVLLFVRATLLYDTLACRLNPEINVENSFKRWRKGFRRRGLRRLRRQARPLVDRALRDDAALQESLKKAAYFAGHLSRNLPQQFNAATSKEAYVASSILKLGSGIAVLLSACLLIASLYSWFTTEELSREVILNLLFRHPVLFMIGLVMAWHNLSNILRRLNELDPNDA